MKNLFVLFVLTLCLSCSNQQASFFEKIGENEILICDMQSIKDTVEIPLSTMVSSCQMVKLENKEEAFFDKTWNTSISENYIAIKSAGRMPVKLFAKNGKFIRNIGAIGKGPGEYTALYGIQLDEPRNRIYLTPFANAKEILVFSLEGEQQESIPLAIFSGKVRTFIEGETLTALCLPFPGQAAIAFQQKLDGTLIQAVSPKKFQFARDYNSEVFSYHQSSTFEMHNTMIDTLYHYDTSNNTLVPKFHVRIPEDNPIFAGYYEVPGYYYVWVGRDERILVNQNSGESHYVRIMNDFFGGFQGELLGGMNGTYTQIIAAIELKDAIAKRLKNAHLSQEDRTILLQLDQEINEEDNSIVFFGEFR